MLLREGKAMNPNKRLLVRLSPDDHAWLLTQAEDEGVDPQTMVVLVIHRLRLGRHPVPVTTKMPANPVYLVPEGFDMSPGAINKVNGSEIIKEYQQPSPVDPTEVEDILASRMQELGQQPAAPSSEIPAVSLHRIPRRSYNPGRSG